MSDDINVCYALYFDFESKELSSIDELIKKKIIECISTASKLSKDYLWQNQSFNIEKNHLQDKEYGSIIGETNCGESINDEWFIVYILLQISISHPDIAICVEDDDGQFLLIEAADYLPNWLKPETSENRVFIHKGQIHVIPIPSKPSEITVFPTGTPSIQQALKLIFGSYETTASKEIQNAINAKTNKFKDSFDDLFHHCHCYLPSSLAYVLNQRPDLVSLAVQNFHNDQSANHLIERYTDCFRDEQRFLTRVRFTKLMYSQLLHKSLERSTASAWENNPKKEISKKAIDMGYKLTAGFGLVYSKAKRTEEKEDMSNDPRWLEFINSLQKYGFFKDEVEGSKQWKILNEKAKEFFYNISSPGFKEKEEMQANIFKELIDDAKKQIEVKQEKLLPEDDDNWLNITQEHLDNLLENHFKTFSKKDSHQESASANLEQVVNKMKNFIVNESDFEGVEVKSNDDIEFNLSSIEKKLRKFIEHDDDDGDSGDNDSDDDDVCNENEASFDSCQDEQWNHIMTAMNQELRNTTITGSFESMPVHENKNINESRSNNQADDDGDDGDDDGDDGDDDDDDDDTINIDYNLIKNFLQSVSSQEGFSGPVSNILTSLGTTLPLNSND